MNIKDIRTRKGLTQAEVASALGVSSVVYSRYETGSRQPSIDILIQLADIFGVTVDYLLGRQDIEDSIKDLLQGTEAQIAKVISDDPIIFFEPLCRAGVDVYFVIHVNHSYRVL